MYGEEPMTFMMLPNDLLLNCLARVSRMYYPTLSLISKRFRSLLVSTELYQTRILLSSTESCLYVCLKLPTYYGPQHWFTLCRRPNSSKKVLVPITSPTSPSRYQSDFVKVGSNIYAIGGFINDDNASSSVMVMDCRSHTWREAPSMRLGRVTPSAGVHDGKIYVTGGRQNLDATNWMEVFDTKTQTWEFESANRYDGNVYIRCFEKTATYKLNKGRWRAGDLAMGFGWLCSSSYSVIENVLYISHCKMIHWYDTEEKCWKNLEGLEQLFSFPSYVDAKVTDYGGKLVVLWKDKVSVNGCHHETKIWCAKIALEKCQGKIWGTLEWFDVVYTTSEPYDVTHVLATTL